MIFQMSIVTPRVVNPMIIVKKLLQAVDSSGFEFNQSNLEFLSCWLFIHSENILTGIFVDKIIIDPC